MKAREKHPCFFLSTNLCRCGFTPPALRACKPGAKNRHNQRRKKQGTGRRKPKSESKKCAFPSRSNRKPSPRPRPRLSTVYPVLALPGLPLPRRLRFAPPSPWLRLSSFLSLPPFSGRSARFSGALRPRRVGFSLARRVGFSRSWAVQVFPRLAGAGAGAWLPGCVRCRVCCAFRGASVPLDTIRNNSNILRSQNGTQIF